MSFPKSGMTYEQVKKKLEGPLGRSLPLKRSLYNQLRLHEGESAVTELVHEIDSSKPKEGSSLSGAGNKQCGIGPGRKLGDGRWTFKNGRWEKSN